MLIETHLLVVGDGPAALVVAKAAAGLGLPCLLLGHEFTGGDERVALDDAAIADLVTHGLLDVLRPHLDGPPVSIAVFDFEATIKHHCVADLNITVYDRMTLLDVVSDHSGLRGVITDGRSRWPVAADAFVDASSLPGDLNRAVTAGIALACRLAASAT